MSLRVMGTKFSRNQKCIEIKVFNRSFTICWNKTDHYLYKIFTKQKMLNADIVPRKAFPVVRSSVIASCLGTVSSNGTVVHHTNHLVIYIFFEDIYNRKCTLTILYYWKNCKTVQNQITVVSNSMLKQVFKIVISCLCDYIAHDSHHLKCFLYIYIYIYLEVISFVK